MTKRGPMKPFDRSRAAEVLEQEARQIRARIEMVEQDLGGTVPYETVIDHEVLRALARSLELRAAVWRNTCRNGSCRWKPEDLTR
jgi:hypothetical protein